MKKVLCFFSTEKGYRTLCHAIDAGLIQHIGAVVSFKEKNVKESFFISIERLCLERDIIFYNWQEVKNDLQSVILRHDITGAVAISWQFVLPLYINQALEDPLIIFHDSLLPKYRGFAPLPTAVMCGDTEVGISVLFAVDEVDRGNIIIQKRIRISPTEYISEIIHRISLLYAKAFEELIEAMVQGNITSFSQNDEQASYSIWRSPEDCRIDWGKSSEEIYNMIRAVSYPYPGAFTLVEGKKVFVHRSEIEDDLYFAVRNPGKVWTIKDNQPIVICGRGMLRITSAQDESGVDVLFRRVRLNLG